MLELEVIGNFNLIGCYKKCNGLIIDEILFIKLDFLVMYVIMWEDVKGLICIFVIIVWMFMFGYMIWIVM